jgi:formylmethanofuran dehydrogenase subunit C
MPIVFQLRSPTRAVLDLAPLVPNRLVGLSSEEVRRVPLQVGNTQQATGDVFLIRGRSDGEIVFDGDLPMATGIGAEMTEGQVLVLGEAGPEAGRAMRGGQLRIETHAADRLGIGMSGGLIEVRGNAGNEVGAAAFASERGMTGGTILIHGAAGSEVGRSLRRGTIFVGGLVGDDLAAGMLAGTIVVAGPVGLRAGVGLKRGSLICLGPEPELPVSYRFSCTDRPQFVRLYLKQLASHDLPIPPEAFAGAFRRYSGDLLTGGRGECLVLES